MAGPDVPLENPQPLTNGVHEVRKVEIETVQTNEAPVEAIQTNGIHTDPSTETIETNGFHASPLSSEPETNGVHTPSPIQTNGVHPEIQTNGIHPESIQTNGVHDPFDADAHITAIPQEAPVVNGIHPLKAAKLEAAAADSTTNSPQLEPEHVSSATGINKTRSDSGVGMTNETTAY